MLIHMSHSLTMEESGGATYVHCLMMVKFLLAVTRIYTISVFKGLFSAFFVSSSIWDGEGFSGLGMRVTLNLINYTYLVLFLSSFIC